MADSPLTAVKTYRKSSHEATARVKYPYGQPHMWAGKHRPITPIYGKLCHARDVPDMDAFSRIQIREDNGRVFNRPNHTPTVYLTKGTARDWLGRPVHPPIQQVSHAWWNFDDNTDFMIAHEAGTNEFQPLLPINIRKKGLHTLSPPNGTCLLYTSDAADE